MHVLLWILFQGVNTKVDLPLEKKKCVHFAIRKYKWGGGTVLGSGMLEVVEV